MGGSALGNVLGGNLADRYGKRRVAGVMLALAGIPLFFISLVGWSPWLFLLVPLSGMLTGSVHSIIVVIAQSVIRGGMALASGLTLGIMFTAGAFGTLLSGPLADAWGFPGRVPDDRRAGAGGFPDDVAIERIATQQSLA
jgi:predicted MFS family arabinose efflux permease